MANYNCRAKWSGETEALTCSTTPGSRKISWPQKKGQILVLEPRATKLNCP